MKTGKKQAKWSFFISLLILVLSLAYSAYGATDGYSPKPDPATWRFVPAAMGPTTIYMKATPAIDVNNSPVRYYFECTDHPEATSGWVLDADYTATGLTPGTTYSFKLRVCDADATDPNTKTRWSRVNPATTTDINTTPPVLKLDLNDDLNNDDANTQTGFVPLALESSGSEVGGVIIDLEGNISSTRRDNPCGGWEKYDPWFQSIPGDPCWYNPRAGERIYRDFICGTNQSGVTITLWGLGVNRDCNITMWAYDAESAGENRVANWYANGTYIFDTNFIGGAVTYPKFDNQDSGAKGWKDLYKYTFSGRATADYLGRIILTSSRDPESPEDQPFAFVNAIKVEPNALTPFVPTEYAYHPVPVDGAEDVPIDVTLEWEKGGYAESHDVYLGTNFDDVNDANRSNPLGVLVSLDHLTTTYVPPTFLDFDTTYYWRIDEVNSAPDHTIFRSEVWSFKTPTYFIMENFDSYADNTALRNVWESSGTSAEVSVETTIAFDGNSMRYLYENDSSPYYSEAYADIAVSYRNWLGIGAQALALRFYGDSTNPTDEQMYVKLTDGDIPANTATVNYGNMDHIKLQQWVKWSIALTEFNDVNLANVARITIGFGDAGAGSAGTVYFEDIQILNQAGEELPELPEIKGDWIGTWATGQQLVESRNNPASPGLANNTLRQMVHATLGGSIIRVHFSNKYTTTGGPVTINSARIALTANSSPVDSSIITSTDTALTFNGGLPSVTIPAGEEIYSDPVDFNVPPLSDLTVSIYFGSASSTNVTGHPGSRTSYYIKTGNTISDAEMESGYKGKHWYILSRIDVLLDDSYGCVVTLGDSITDGRGCDDNYNNRWPDKLASRLQADPDTVKVGVINQGIGGNCVVSGGLGPTALARFDHDVLEQPGVRWVMIFEGINDIGGAWSPLVVTNLINAYQEFIDKTHANGILVYGVPITPFKGSGYANENPNRLTYRNSVNDWIRTSGEFDAVIDFDPVVWDPADHEKLNPAYLYQNDYLHINATGYQAMVDSIDLDLFKLRADLYEDGIVNLVDFAILAGQWLQAPGSPSADIVPLQGGDGIVDFEDLYLMALEWLREE